MRINFLIALLGFISISENIYALTRNSYELATCKDLALEASQNRYLEGFSLLPRDWNDFVSVRYAKEGRMRLSLAKMARTNELALVPGTPVIAADSKISREYTGWGLLAISREEKFHETYGTKGRYAILAGPDKEDLDSLRFLSYFIPAEIARIIMAQLPDFDPSAQPLAFGPEFTEGVELEKQGDDESRGAIRAHYREEAGRERKDPAPWAVVSQDGSVRWPSIIAVVLILGLLGTLAAMIAKRQTWR